MNRLLLTLLLWGIAMVYRGEARSWLPDTTTVNRFDTICQGDTLKFFNQRCTIPGRYRHFKRGIKPIFDSLFILQLWVKPVYRQRIQDTICQGEQRRVGDQFFSTGGTHTVIFPNNRQRCDSTVQLNLHVLPTSIQQRSLSLCLGDTMRLGTERYYYPTVATLRYNASNGCDSIVQYRIEMLDTFRTRLRQVVCRGTPVRIGLTTFTARRSGTFFYRFPATAQRCDSVIELQLQVLDTFLTQIQERSCAGTIRRLGPLQLSSTGVYRYTFPANSQRCDSTVVLNLQIVPPIETRQQVTLCEGEVLRVGDQTLSRSGEYSVLLKSKEGCDSVVRISLRMRAGSSSTQVATICMGSRYRFGQRWLTQAGVYTDTLSARLNGCDSIVRLELRVEQMDRSVINTSICRGQSYPFDGRSLQAAGTYYDTLRSTGFCPIVFELNLKINPTYQDTLQASICQGQSYRLGNNTYTRPGFYQQRLRSAQGCDSIQVLRLRVLPSYRDTLRAAICVGDTFRFGQLKYVREGLYPIRFNARNGCDSIIVIQLRHYPIQRDTFPVALCAGDTFRLGRVKYFQTGLYPITLRDRNSCDSILYIKVTRNPVYQQQFSLNACFGRQIRFGQQILTRSGVYTERFRTQAGCDSTVRLQLQLEAIDTLVQRGGILLSATNHPSVRRYEWIDCNSQILVSQQSSPFFLPSRTGTYAVRLYTDSCVYVSGCHSVQLATSSLAIDLSAQIQVYPNPVSRMLNIKLPVGLTGSYRLRISTAEGRVLQQQTLQLNELNTLPLPDYPPGFLVLNLQHLGGKGEAVLRLLKTE